MSWSAAVPRKRPSVPAGLERVAGTLWARGHWRQGPELGRLEAAIAARLGGAEVAAVASGRFALLVLLEALAVPPGATVLLASYNASCVPNILQAGGYHLHFVDVDPETLLLDPRALPAEAPPGARALLITHIEGCPAPPTALRQWARERGLRLVEDAAHALGARYDGRPVGSFGDGAVFSLGRGKHLNALGGGLAVVPAHTEAAARLRRRVDGLPAPTSAELARAVLMERAVSVATEPRFFGLLIAPLLRHARRRGRDPATQLFEDSKEAMQGVPPRMKRRLSNLQARLALDSLEHRLDRELERRRVLARRLRGALSGVAQMQRIPDGAEPAWLELTLLVDEREQFQRRLAELGVDTQRSWMDACDRLPAFRSASPPCPMARSAAARAVYLPTYPALTDAQCQRVIDAVRRVLT